MSEINSLIKAFFLTLLILSEWGLSAQTFEAESANLSGVSIFSGRNASGGQYVDFQNPSGDFIEWEVQVATSGTYQLGFVYQLGRNPGRPLELDLNGSTLLVSLDFPPTGSWSSWDTTLQSISLTAGLNKIRLTAIGSSGPNFDFLYLEGEEASCESINLSNVLSYAGNQDKGSSSILDQQKTIFLENNAWKAIPFSYNITPNTRIDFDF
ncbi:MAG: carbohydrate-binding protein, partial [Bacteroidota bacterium]